ncbi:MAG: glutamate--tRNA ligase [Candidatus Vogelbacteria bacterium]|nr:glutamate--tRNA ligase [Candidatus Vogelbacteria bacterium]
MSVIVRFAPSPTGPLHLGGARTALFNYLFARKTNGKFLLRIEDTDRERSKPEFEKDILDSLAWLSLDYDDVSRQSERTTTYAQYLEQLLKENKAYTNSGEEVIRLRNPGRSVAFTDLIRGEIAFNTTELGDFIIAKNPETPLYHLAVVIDDWEMEITHVIRGEDHIANTPRQILIQEALGSPRPQYAHLPLILAPDRSKLSKRHGAVSVAEYRARGYLPEALINYLALLGWNPGTDEEIFSLAELSRLFSFDQVQKSGAVFDLEKLNWFNREYLQHLSDHILWQSLPNSLDQTMTQKILPLIRERAVTLADLPLLVETEGELGYFFRRPIYDKILLRNQKHFVKLRALIESIPTDDFQIDRLKTAIMPYAVSIGRGEVLWPFRVALTGREKSADPFLVAAILGQGETLARLDYAASLV